MEIMEQSPGNDSNRPHTVSESLADLAGPQHGTVELPEHLHTPQQRSYNLDIDEERRLFYETVINEAVRVEDLNALLDRDHLIDLWPRLWVPRASRGQWERQFPELAARRMAADDDSHTVYGMSNADVTGLAAPLLQWAAQQNRTQ
jgi:hypothetical protein